jgi:signal transduction histidine kinase
MGSSRKSSANDRQKALKDTEKNKDEPQYYISIIGKVSAAISGLRDLDAMLKIGLDNVLESMDGDVGGIMLLDKKTKILSYRVYHNLSKEYAEGIKLRLGEGIAGKVAQSGKAKLVGDVSLEPNAVHPSIMSEKGLKAFMSVPLKAKGTVLGIMNVASYIPRNFTDKDMFFLLTIGDQLGTAIEQTRLYDQLKMSRERYRQLAQQILVAQEEERRRVAKELHDETSQSLSGLALNLQALVEMAELDNMDVVEFKSGLKKVHTLAVQISTKVGRLIADLRPTLLDTLGLVPAIRHYAETNLIPAGIEVSFNFDVEKLELPPETEVELFRIAQGTIGNIVHHSQAKKVIISITTEAKELLLSIIDDGKGFDVSQVTRIEESGSGAGLFSMKERTRLLGGRCVINSKPGKGTKANIRVPYVESRIDAKD